MYLSISPFFDFVANFLCIELLTVFVTLTNCSLTRLTIRAHLPLILKPSMSLHPPLLR